MENANHADFLTYSLFFVFGFICLVVSGAIKIKDSTDFSLIRGIFSSQRAPGCQEPRESDELRALRSEQPPGNALCTVFYLWYNL